MEYAIQIVFLHVTWLYKRLLAEDADDDRVEALLEKRTRAKDIYYKLALTERANSAEAVRKQVSREKASLCLLQAFIAFVNLHMLFAKKNESQLSAAKVTPLEVEDEAQHRLEGVFASVAERYASDLADEREGQGESRCCDQADAQTPRRTRRRSNMLSKNRRSSRSRPPLSLGLGAECSTWTTPRNRWHTLAGSGQRTMPSARCWWMYSGTMACLMGKRRRCSMSVAQPCRE